MIDKTLDFAIRWFRHLLIPRCIENLFCKMDLHNLKVWVEDERIHAYCMTCKISYSSPVTV